MYVPVVAGYSIMYDVAYVGVGVLIIIYNVMLCMYVMYDVMYIIVLYYNIYVCIYYYSSRLNPLTLVLTPS